MSNIKKFCPLDLRSVLNEKLFYKKGEVEGGKNVGLGGLHFLLEENDVKPEIKSESGVPFRLWLGNYDSFYLDGQELDVGAEADSIHFLGFTYFGDAQTEVVLQCENEETLDLKVKQRECSADCYSDDCYLLYEQHPEELERVVTYQVAGREPWDFYFFDRVCTLGKRRKIQKMIFPKYLFFHLIAITLECVQ